MSWLDVVGGAKREHDPSCCREAGARSGRGQGLPLKSLARPRGDSWRRSSALTIHVWPIRWRERRS